jgi:hypothetical protein
MDKIESIHNKKDNMSNPGMGQESSPAQDVHKLRAQYSDASSPYSTTRREIKHRKRDDTKMEKMFAALSENTKLQMKQQEERHAKEIADMIQAYRDAHDLLTTKQLHHKT